ncbi:family S53 protease-like protein [Lentinula aciculospora]|uniref:Family S53 protease-like protein n=1 Tax=Lentinula aciculospora TaxID=153920 RepID=A0A9W8ZWT3_9AGAR|nr:family S53 protease-like protein [Lentinula aciculospora]
MVRLASYYSVLLSGLAFSMAASIPARRAMVIHDQRELPGYFANSGTPSPDMLLNLKIALTAQDMAGLEQRFWDVSTPGNALYGQHLSFEETKVFAGPAPDTVSAVTTWLNENGVSNITTSGAFDDWLAFTVPISTANSLFDADFQSFSEIGGPTQLIRTLAYSLPVDLQQHIKLIHPSTDFVRNIKGPKFSASVPGSSLNNTARALGAPTSCNSVVTPACLQDLYGIPTTPATQASNKLGVSGFIGQWAQTADLRTFLGGLRPDIASTTTFTLQTLDGGSNPQSARDAGIEANLDIQYTVGVATGVPVRKSICVYASNADFPIEVTFISVGDDNTDGIDGFLDIMNNINAQTAPPHVLTTSYGFDEPELTSALANQLCNAYMASGTRGVSILFASGDGGVSGSQSQSCTTFIPTFPSGCPFLTSVGATQDVTETAASFSSGGFSKIFARPSYQTTDVANYLTTLGSTNAGKFSTTGRAFPDVAAQGVNVEIVDGGEAGLVAGTSCASPIFASVISLINDRLVAAGKSPLGFLNPFLYANPSAFSDITSGSNPGCNTNGFPAMTGWDPVTGLGSPNFASLLAAAGV